MSSSSSSSSAPLATFMKCLLSESSGSGSLSFSSAHEIPLIVDNARSCGSPRGSNRVMEDQDLPPFETSRKRNKNSNTAYQSQVQRRQRGSSAPLPPITRDSRWETSSRSASENESQHNPVPLPSRPVPGTFGSPAVAFTKRKAVVEGTPAAATASSSSRPGSPFECESDDESQSSRWL